MNQIECFTKDLSNVPEKYASLPFWSWNDKLEEDELRRQIRDMKEKGYGGFFMHARGGLLTEYLSDDWFSAVRTCMDEAEKCGLTAWAYDEDGWPSGFAGGKLLKDERYYASFLRYEVKDEFDPAAFATFLWDGKNEPVRTLTPQKNGAKYHTIYRVYDKTYVDVMNASVTKEFVEITHGEYKRRLGKDFGTKMPGFFTDEPQYFRWATPWSDTFIEGFPKEYGYDARDHLLKLFVVCPGSREFRFDYFRLCNRYYTEHFVKVIYDYLHSSGAKLTGHSVEEAGVIGQMWTCGGIMPFYEYEDIPGMDWLGRPIGNDISPKQVSSVAAQLGKEQCLTETFACCGWDVTPRDLKKLTEWQFAAGINVMCQHLMAYSIRGQRKKDYPASYSEHLAWYGEYKEYNDYFTRLGFALTRGEEVADVLLISPVHGGYLDFQRETADGFGIGEIDAGYHKAVETLSNLQIGYHIGDEWLMEKYGSVRGNKLIVGKRAYSAVVLAKTDTVDKSTAKLLREFLAAGGKLLLLSGAPTRIEGRTADTSFLKSNVTPEELRKNYGVLAADESGNVPEGLRIMRRKTAYGNLWYLVNLSEKAYTVTLKNAPCKFVSVDLLTGKTAGADEKALAFSAGQSYLLIEGDLPAEKPIAYENAQDLGTTFAFREKPVNELTLAYARLSYDGKTYGDLLPLEGLQDLLLKSRYRGEIYLKHEFTVDEIPASMRLIAENDNYLSVTVNGSPVSVNGDWWLDRSFRSADILPLLKKGRNEIVFRREYFQRDYVYYVLYGGVSETLKNCLNYDTELNQIYLVGDFKVKANGAFRPAERNSKIFHGEFTIAPSEAALDLSRTVEEGYPFFAGTLKLQKTFVSDGKPTRLLLSGRYATAKVRLNGTPVGDTMFTDEVVLTSALKRGENLLEIDLVSGNRNLLGPHYNVDSECYFVCPSTFTAEGTWENGKSTVWRDDPSFVFFGLTSARLESEK